MTIVASVDKGQDTGRARTHGRGTRTQGGGPGQRVRARGKKGQGNYRLG